MCVNSGLYPRVWASLGVLYPGLYPGMGLPVCVIPSLYPCVGLPVCVIPCLYPGVGLPEGYILVYTRVGLPEGLYPGLYPGGPPCGLSSWFIPGCGPPVWERGAGVRVNVSNAG